MKKMVFHFDESRSNKIVGREISSALKGTESLKIAVAYVSASIGEILRIRGRPMKGLVLICDAWSGNCNPYVLRNLVVKENAQIYAYNKLHAKVFIGSKAVVVGSANISRDALIRGTVEGIAISFDPSTLSRANDWFEKIVSGADDISKLLKDPKQFQRLVDIWKQPVSMGSRHKISLKEAFDQNHHLLDQFVIGFYVDEETEITDKQLRNEALLRGKKMPPGERWIRFEEHEIKGMTKLYERVFERAQKKLISFEVKEQGECINKIVKLDSTILEFISMLDIKGFLETNFLEVKHGPFALTGKDAAELCRQLSGKLKHNPELGRKLWKKTGWIVSPDDLIKLLSI